MHPSPSRGLQQLQLTPACPDQRLACRHAPFLVPFLERAQVFQEVVVSMDRSTRQEGPLSPFSFHHDAPQFLTVRRGHMLEVRSPTGAVLLLAAAAHTSQARNRQAVLARLPGSAASRLQWMRTAQRLPVALPASGWLLQDGYEQLGGTDVRGRVRIQFVDEHGTHEAGVDGGGLFKDFMEGLVKEGFSLRTWAALPLVPSSQCSCSIASWHC